jgi:hypothetical protein
VQPKYNKEKHNLKSQFIQSKQLGKQKESVFQQNHIVRK